MVKIRSQWQVMQHQQEQQASSDQPPLPNQIIEHEPEPEAEPLAVVVFNGHAKPLIRSDDDLELRPIKILRLFGVNIPIYHFHIDHHHDAAAAVSTQQTQAMITFHDHHHDKRRKPRDDDDDLPESSHRLPKRPKLLVDIPKIPTTSDNNYAENPNIDHQQVEEEHKHEHAAPPPPAAVEFDPRRLMVEGVTEGPVLLFTKMLMQSDVVQQHNRLLIPESESRMLLAALTETERKRVLKIKEDNLSIVATAFNGRVEDEATEFTLHLTKWLSSGAIVLKKQWMRLVRANNLEQDDSVEAWGYRLRGQFRLAFNIIKKVELPQG